MSDPYHIPDGELCRICGLTFYSRSYGGPGICPSCDCGNFGIQAIENQRKEIQRLAASVDRLTSDKARLANELAAEQESNTFLNNLHGMDVARVETLEVVLRRVQTALDQTSPVLWKALKAAVNEVLTPTGTPTNPTMQHAPDCPILHGKECLCDPFPLETVSKPDQWVQDGKVFEEDAERCSNMAHKRYRLFGCTECSTVSKLCPHGFVLADNTCGPCSEGRPNRMKGDDHG